jgi:hypothetical protein
MEYGVWDYIDYSFYFSCDKRWELWYSILNVYKNFIILIAYHGK